MDACALLCECIPIQAMQINSVRIKHEQTEREKQQQNKIQM